MTPLGEALRDIQWRGNKRIDAVLWPVGKQIAQAIIANGERRGSRTVLTQAGAARVKMQMRSALSLIRPNVVAITQSALQETVDLSARTEGKP